MDHDALRAEIEADPAKLGYASRMSSGDDRGVADLLNAVVGPGSGPVALQWMRRDPFLAAIVPLMFALSAKDAATQSKWDRVLAGARAAEWISMSQAAQLLGLAKADGLIDQAGIDSILVRTGSRAEVLFGADAFVSPGDVAAAFGRP